MDLRVIQAVLNELAIAGSSSADALCAVLGSLSNTL